MGVEPYLLTSTIRATAAQRLVRKLCTNCKKPRVTTSTEAATFTRANLTPPAAVYDAVGCSICAHSGYKGRTPVIEVVPITDALADAVRDSQSESRLTRIALGQGLLSLAHHALTLVASGITSLSEALQVIDGPHSNTLSANP
jgi:type II secretory ATPase GspE/PulE/Tfp pilus assembly ATPase PilB-like protein